MFLLNSFQFQSTLEEITFLPTQARALSSGIEFSLNIFLQVFFELHLDEIKVF